jgi:transcriptional regulator with XRE-family HTH domain
MSIKTGKALLAARKKANFSQKQAAAFVDVSLRAWCYYERGEREPHPALVAFFIKALKGVDKPVAHRASIAP